MGLGTVVFRKHPTKPVTAGHNRLDLSSRIDKIIEPEHPEVALQLLRQVKQMDNLRVVQNLTSAGFVVAENITLKLPDHKNIQAK